MSEQQVSFFVTNDAIFAENGYTAYVRDGGSCWVIDPGPPPQAEQVLGFISEHRLKPEALVLTHAHADHIAGVDEVLAGIGQVPVYLAREEWAMLTDARENLSASMGMPVTARAEDVRDLAVGSTLTLESTTWEVRDVAGHSPGGRCLYCAAQSVAIVGDALFAGSVGRVDFPHSDGNQLMRNIHASLMTLPDDTRVLSGHGPETTIGVERTTNPFVVHGL